jgi:hypothetical protein
MIRGRFQKPRAAKDKSSTRRPDRAPAHLRPSASPALTPTDTVDRPESSLAGDAHGGIRSGRFTRSRPTRSMRTQIDRRNS